MISAKDLKLWIEKAAVEHICRRRNSYPIEVFAGG